MERERWAELYRLAVRLGKCWPQGWLYSVPVVVGVYLWAVVHDRPVSWACDRKNWPAELPWHRLPSQSTMSRRIRSQPFQALLQAMEQELRGSGAVHWFKILDSKPLIVGTYSKDREATWGYAAKRLARGYKLHAISDDRAVPIWCVEPMNVHETNSASRLIPTLAHGGYLVGDSQFDNNRLYDLAAAKDLQLVAPRQRPKSRGIGHHHHSPARLRSLELQTHEFGVALLHARNRIEGMFGSLTSFGGGLAPLPSWVRRLHRVKSWVQAKLLINAIRLTHLRTPPPATA